jgi:hypothetical protein
VGHPVRALTANAEGEAILLLTEPPWLLRQPADNGPAVPIAVRAGLGWASSVLVSQDGSLYVGGASVFAGTAVELQVQQLSAEGELLSSARLSGSTVFGGMTEGSDGIVRVAAYVGERVVVGDVKGDAIEIEPEVSVPLGLLTAKNSPLQAFAMNAPGLYAFGGAGEDAWVSFAANSTITLEDFSTSSMGGLSSDGANGWYLAWAEGWTNQASGLGRFHQKLTRYDSSGNPLWTHSTELNPNPRPESDTFYRFTKLVPLSDSVLLASATGPTPSGPTVLRLAKDGTVIGAVQGVGRVALAAAAGDLAAYFLSAPAELHKVSFPKVTVTLRKDGEACTANEFCESSLCCIDAVTKSGVCSSEACANGSLCSADEGCADGKCLVSKGAPSQAGFCSSACAASKECPQNTFCVDDSCLPSCTGNACAYPNTSCSDVRNTENVLVSVCAFPPEPPKLKTLGEACLAGTECASAVCCQAKLTAGLECATSATCLQEVGGRCQKDAQCRSGDCNGEDGMASWCNTTCTVDADCGVNPLGSAKNRCMLGSGGVQVCFPGCTTYTDSVCENYGASATCSATASGWFVCSY